MPRVLLRTKLLPEIEEIQANLRATIASDEINELDETMVKDKMRSLEVLFERRQDLIQNCIKKYNELRDEVELKKRVDDDSDDISSADGMDLDHVPIEVKVFAKETMEIELASIFKFMYSGI